MARHPDLVDADLHVPGYIQSSDPGAVGAGIQWIDTSGGAGAWKIKIRNTGDTDWELTGGGAPSAENITRYDKYGDGALGAVFSANISVPLSPSYSPVSLFNLDGSNAPDGLISVFGDAQGNDQFFGAVPGTIVFDVTLTDDTAIQITDDGEGNLLNATYNVAGTYNYASTQWELTFSGLVPKNGTSIEFSADAYSTPYQAGVSVADCLLKLHGGVPPFTYSISDDNWTSQTDDVDPTMAAIVYTDVCSTPSPGSYVFNIRIRDYLWYQVEVNVFVTFDDPQNLCGI